MKKIHRKAGLLAAAAGLAFVINGHAQSVDSLLNKLVEKGVLTTTEAADLRKESEQDFAKAYAAKSGLPKWVNSFKFHGDLRGRYESFYFENPAGVDRHRFRYRLRFGVVANLTDNFELGLRLTSSEAANGGSGGDPISGNATFQDNGSKKLIYIDLAYAKWSPLRNDDWSLTTVIGKMENPFVFSDMVFDGDYTPEGAAIQLAHHFNADHSARLNAGIFAVDEISGNSADPYFFGAQLRFDSKWNARWQTTFGVAALALVNDEMLTATRGAAFGGPGGTNIVGGTPNWTVPNQNGGNLRTPIPSPAGTGGTLLASYNPVIVDGAVTYTLEKFWLYPAPFPIRLAADYMNNPAASTANEAWSVGVTFGKSGKKGLWDLSYRYKHLEGDAWFEEFVDSDFGAFYQSGTGSLRSAGGSGYLSGTNVKGHIVKASYSPFDSLTLGLTAFITELIQPNPTGSQSGSTRIQMDALWKF